MNKLLFGCCLLPMLFLGSCGKTTLSSSLEEDKSKMKEAREFSSDTSEYFSTLFQVKKSESVYRISFTLDQAKKEFHQARVLLTPKKDQFFPFGYENDYTLVQDKDEADKNKNRIYGININFSSVVELDTLYGYFTSQEVGFFFQVSTSEV